MAVEIDKNKNVKKNKKQLKINNSKINKISENINLYGLMKIYNL